MKKQLTILLLFISVLSSFISNAQEDSIVQKDSRPAKLFRNQDILPIKMRYSNNQLRKETNDSTYMKSNITYQEKDGSWKTLEIDIRARGNFRKENCYYTPVKISIEKENAKGTLFKGNKKLKLVIPCKTDKFANDFILKEYLVYKLYEALTPYSFSTRLVTFDYEEIRRNKTKTHQLFGFLVEDDKNIAKRMDGKILKTTVHPLEQDPQYCVRHDFFQFLIGNIDFSSAFQHNAELLYKENSIIPIPYDFDMSGIVNTNYSDQLAPQLEKLNISSVTTRRYRGFNHNPSVFNTIRAEYLSNKESLLNTTKEVEQYLDNKKELEKFRNFILSFYKILEDDSRFKSNIISQTRK